MKNKLKTSFKIVYKLILSNRNDYSLAYYLYSHKLNFKRLLKYVWQHFKISKVICYYDNWNVTVNVIGILTVY